MSLTNSPTYLHLLVFIDVQKSIYGENDQLYPF